MSKPPSTPPSSDIDGVRQDKKSPPVAARKAGQTAADLKRAKDQARARPDYSGERGDDDRSG